MEGLVSKLIDESFKKYEAKLEKGIRVRERPSRGSPTALSVLYFVHFQAISLLKVEKSKFNIDLVSTQVLFAFDARGGFH